MDGRRGRAERVVALVLAMALLAGSLTITAGSPGANRALAAAATPAASPIAAATAAVTFSGLIIHPGPVALTEIEQLPQETITASYLSGGAQEEHTFTGTRLYAVLDHLGFAVDPDAKNPLLRMYVVITANDGYQVVISGGEVDPNFGNAPIMLAWEQDGAPLAGDDGPLRLVVPGDVHGGRYVHGIVSIDVRGLDDIDEDVTKGRSPRTI